MKRMILFFICIIILLSGCTFGKTEIDDDVYANNVYSDKNMVTIDNDEYNALDTSNTITIKEYGIGIKTTENLQKMMIDNKVSGSVMPHFVRTSYITEYSNKTFSEYKENNDISTLEEKQEYIDDIQNSVFDIFGIFCKSDNSDETQYYYSIFEDMYEKTEKIGEFEGNEYYFGYNTDYSDKDISTSEKEDINILINEIEMYKDGIALFPPVK